FQLTLSGDGPQRFLAPLAYFALHLPARLSLHPAGREPIRSVADLPEHPDHDAARGSLARGELDVRRLGRLPRPAAAWLSGGAPGLGRSARGPAPQRDVRSRRRGLGLVPSDELRHG